MVGRLHGQAVSLDVPIRVREMSLGGMSIETAFPIPIDAVQEFALELGDGSQAVLVGRVKYSRLLEPLEPADSEAAVYLSGIEFVDEDPDTLQASVEDVIRKVT
jgi:hypothetical protein